MLKNDARFLLLCFLCFLAPRLQAQEKNPDIIPGYYIDARGDSLAGQFHIGGLKQNDLRFRADGRRAWTTLTPQEVRLIKGENGLLILPQEIRTAENPEKIWTREIVHGVYSLYQGLPADGSSLFFMQMESNAELIKLNPHGFMSQLDALIGICAQTSVSRSAQYNVVKMTRLFKAINQCASPEEKTASPLVRNRVKLGLEAQAFHYIVYPSGKIREDNFLQEGTGYLTTNFNKTTQNSGGLYARCRFSALISVFAGVQYLHYTITSDSFTTRLSYIRDEPGIPPREVSSKYRFAEDIESRYLEFPLGLTYHVLPFKKISPTVNIGFILPVPLTFKVKTAWGYPVGLPSRDEYGYLEPVGASIQFDRWRNFFVGGGLRFKRKNQNEWGVQAAYYFQTADIYADVNKLPSPVSAKIFSNRLQIGLSYTFYSRKK